jgi:hypothetical protein
VTLQRLARGCNMVEDYNGVDVINSIMDKMYEIGLVDTFIQSICDLSLDDDEAYELMIRWDMETDDAFRVVLEEKMQLILEKHNRRI